MDRPYPSCKTCNNIITQEWRRDKRTINRVPLLYCCRACANNRGSRTTETKQKISNTLKKHPRYQKKPTKFLINNTLTIIDVAPNKQPIIKNCITCGNEFVCSQFNGRKSGRKTCSKGCQMHILSIKRQEYLKTNGNFATTRESFTYKDVTINVDSKLEKAGIVYLIDILKATRIERFINILNYWEGDIHRTYNPDFICQLETGESCIVEVKQRWTAKSNHSYNRTIPFKKIALEKFCKDHNMLMLWMDFDTCPQLINIYKKILSTKN